MLSNSVPLLCYAIQTMCDAISSTLNYLYPQCVRNLLRHEAVLDSQYGHQRVRNLPNRRQRLLKQGYLTKNAIGKVHLAYSPA